MSDFRKLQVWQKAHALSLESAAFARLFTRKRRGLADQITRAADALCDFCQFGDLQKSSTRHLWQQTLRY